MVKRRQGQHRKHTPIVSEAQRRLFGAVAGGSVSLPGLSPTKAKEHLVEVKGQKLPQRTLTRAKLVRRRTPSTAHGMSMVPANCDPICGITHESVRRGR